MNVLYINANPRNKLSHTAGYATHMRKTIKGLEAAGHRVVKLLAGDGAEAEGAKQAYRRMNGYMPHRAARMIRDMYEVVHDHQLYRKWLPFAKQERIDFVYERMNQLHTCGLRLARRLGVPFIIEINDPMRETVTVDLSGLMKRYAIFLEDRLVWKSDFVVLGSEALKKSYAARGFPADKLLVLYPTADLEMFRPEAAHEEIRRRLGLEKKVVVGFVAGDLSAGWRRTDLLLNAIRDVVNRHREVAALVVGDGKLDQDHLVAGKDGATIAFTGKVPYAEVPGYINEMDICVIPNATWYGSPTKLFEYGAMGKAVIAPRYPPIEEVIEDGVSGLLFERENQHDLMRKLESLVDDSGLRKELGRQFQRKIRDQFTWEFNTEAVINAVSRRKKSRV
jgi:glycosyltransferase involved in cell wall biosynthesis